MSFVGTIKSPKEEQEDYENCLIRQTVQADIYDLSSRMDALFVESFASDLEVPVANLIDIDTKPLNEQITVIKCKAPPKRLVESVNSQARRALFALSCPECPNTDVEGEKKYKRALRQPESKPRAPKQTPVEKMREQLSKEMATLHFLDEQEMQRKVDQSVARLKKTTCSPGKELLKRCHNVADTLTYVHSKQIKALKPKSCSEALKPESCSEAFERFTDNLRKMGDEITEEQE